MILSAFYVVLTMGTIWGICMTLLFCQHLKPMHGLSPHRLHSEVLLTWGHFHLLNWLDEDDSEMAKLFVIMIKWFCIRRTLGPLHQLAGKLWSLAILMIICQRWWWWQKWLWPPSPTQLVGEDDWEMAKLFGSEICANNLEYIRNSSICKIKKITFFWKF